MTITKELIYRIAKDFFEIHNELYPYEEPTFEDFKEFLDDELKELA